MCGVEWYGIRAPDQGSQSAIQPESPNLYYTVFILYIVCYTIVLCMIEITNGSKSTENENGTNKKRERDLVWLFIYDNLVILSLLFVSMCFVCEMPSKRYIQSEEIPNVKYVWIYLIRCCYALHHQPHTYIPPPPLSHIYIIYLQTHAHALYVVWIVLQSKGVRLILWRLINGIYWCKQNEGAHMHTHTHNQFM